MKTPNYKKIEMNGRTGALLEKITDNWLLSILETNPAIIDMFRDRDVKPYRDLLPWSGEFAGKYITGAYYVYKATRRNDLLEYIKGFIEDLLKYQDADGYLGCFSNECRLTGAYSQNPAATGLTWDSWGHYHIMFGLMLWYEETNDRRYIDAVEKIAALFMRKFYNGKKRIIDIGSSEMNLSVYHAFCILFNKTKKREYLSFAKKIEEDLSDERAGDYINYSLKGYEYYQCAKPRWESMHIIMGIAEMYRCTNNNMYLDVALQIFYSILKTDVHNTGAFSTDEQAIGTPFRNRAIETCCVIAYNALAIEIYKLTGDPKIIDFLERSHYNAVMGYYSPSGRWSTYNTPMEGNKCANYHSIVFQSRPGSPDLNCCSVNAPRGVASVVEWMIAENEKKLFINGYENLEAETDDGVKIKIEGDYPLRKSVKITVDSNGEKKAISLRIPSWSKNTELTVDGETVTPIAGTYYSIMKKWNGSEIVMNFDYTPWFEKGGIDNSKYDENPGIPKVGDVSERNYYENKYSIFVGPVLYGLDNGENHGVDFFNIPELSFNELEKTVPYSDERGAIHIKTDGIVLTDFYHLGLGGSEYKTWFKIK